MDSKDVQAVLRLAGVNSYDDGSTDRSISIESVADREDTISRLMNVTLHCLGAIRKLVIESEKMRTSLDSTDIDGSQRDTGEGSLLQRQLFSTAVKTMADTIIQGKELLYTDPMKDLIDSYPWAHSLQNPYWLMLDWALMERHVDGGLSESQHVQSTRKVLKYYPDCLAELDKNGQHYMTYALRAQSPELLDELLHHHREGASLADAKGRRAIHYCATYSQSVETLIVLSDYAKRPLADMLLDSLDDYGNTALHVAAAGSCSPEVLNEILFSCSDAIRMRNNDGMLPLHVAAGKGGLQAVQALVSAYPTAISIPDRNQWLPLHHAAYDSRSVEVVKFLHESYPGAMVKPQGTSGRLPIHYAAVKCNSSKIMQYLLEVHPEGAKALDVHRRLPLHNLIARCEHMTAARLRCLRMLLEQYPHGASMADEDGRSPLKLAKRDKQGPLVLRLLLRADPIQDPEALAELSYRASKAKFRSTDTEQH